jgi:hypothetical protein
VARSGRRKGELQTGNPEPLYEIARFRGGKRRERQMKERFRRSRIHGEWFNRTDEIEEWLEEIGASLPDGALATRKKTAMEIWGIWTPQKKLTLATIALFILYLLLV